MAYKQYHGDICKPKRRMKSFLTSGPKMLLLSDFVSVEHILTQSRTIFRAVLTKSHVL